MGKALVLILGHSFIRRLRDHIASSYDNGYTVKLGISTSDFYLKWYDVSGRTIAKIRKHDLSDFGHTASVK